MLGHYGITISIQKHYKYRTHVVTKGYFEGLQRLNRIIDQCQTYTRYTYLDVQLSNRRRRWWSNARMRMNDQCTEHETIQRIPGRLTTSGFVRRGDLYSTSHNVYIGMALFSHVRRSKQNGWINNPFKDLTLEKAT